LGSKGLFVVDEMFGHIRQLIHYPLVYSKYVYDFALFRFEHSPVDETDEHIPLSYLRSVSKDHISLAFSLAKNETLDNMSIFTRADACENDELILD
jgi:hypothetical protein